MILQIDISSILLKLLIEKEWSETAIVTNPAFAAVITRAAEADRNNRQLHGRLRTEAALAYKILAGFFI